MNFPLNRKVWMFVLLAGLGLAGNYFVLHLFFSLDLVFGSVFSMLALQLLGGRLGVAGALVASSITLATWNHPYAILLYTAEAAVVALFKGRQRVSFVVADAIYWCAIGMPLAFLFYYYALGLPLANATVVMLKDAANGIGNALFARMIFMGISWRLRRARFPLHELLSNFMFLLVLLPSLVFLITISRQSQTELVTDIHGTLHAAGGRTKANLEDWLQVRMRAIVRLATRAASQPLPYMQGALERAQVEQTDFLGLALIDQTATIVAHSQPLDPLGQPNIGRTLAELPYVPQLRQSLAPLPPQIVTNLATGQPAPMLSLLAPVVVNGAYAGHVMGVLNLARVADVIAINSQTGLSGELSYALRDQAGAVILSNEAQHKIISLRERGEVTPLGGGLMLWLPAAGRSMNDAERWSQAIYFHESVVGGSAGWQLVLALPVQPLVLTYYANYSWILFQIGVTLLLSLLLAEWLSRRMLTSLEELRGVAADLPQRLQAKTGIDWGAGAILEIKLLKDDIKSIADTQAEKVDEIRQFNAVLESKVAQRTAELGEAERFAHAIVDSLSASLVILDENGTIIFVNRAWQRFAEAHAAASDSVSAGANYLAVCDSATGFDCEGAAEMGAGIRAVLQGARDEFTMEYSCHSPREGRWFLCRATRFPGEGPLRIRIAHEDISERKQSEAELRQLSRAVEHSAASVVITDRTGTIEYVNPWFEMTAGYTRAEALGANPRFLKSGVTSAETYGEMWRLISAGGVWIGDLCNKKKDGSLYWEHAAISGLKDEKGEVTHYVAVKEDITERKAFEAQLLVAKEAAETANTAKSLFLTSMSHEIRTPMNGILGMAQVLLMPGVSEAERLDYARTILGSGKTLLTLLNDILDLSKVEAGKLELELSALHPAQIIGEVQGLFAEIGRAKGLHIESDWSGTPGHYLGDPHRVRQMLSNLVGNAVKFTAQGQIRIEAREVGRDGQTAVLEFSVSDTGIGIAQDKQLLLFQPFSQADNSITRRYGGSGLGLSLVANLAHLMGGEVGVESEPGRGSRFWFRIRVEVVAADSHPMVAPDSHPPAALPEAAVPSGTATQLSGNLLVVEDNPGNQKVIEILLLKLGLGTAWAEDGQQALDAVTRGEAADLILMDVQMPRLDGYAATAAIRRWEQETGAPRRPIIALTADAFEEDRRRCLEAGMDDVLTKPVVFEALKDALAKWLPAVAATVTAVADKPLDVARVAALVQEILPLLAQNKFNALGRFRALREAVAGTAMAAEIDAAWQLLEGLNFAATLERLRHLATTYGLERI